MTARIEGQPYPLKVEVGGSLSDADSGFDDPGVLTLPVTRIFGRNKNPGGEKLAAAASSESVYKNHDSTAEISAEEESVVPPQGIVSSTPGSSLTCLTSPKTHSSINSETGSQERLNHSLESSLEVLNDGGISSGSNFTMASFELDNDTVFYFLKDSNSGPDKDRKLSRFLSAPRGERGRSRLTGVGEVGVTDTRAPSQQEVRTQRTPRRKIRSKSADSKRYKGAQSMFSSLYTKVLSPETMRNRKMWADVIRKDCILEEEYYKVPYEECNWEIIYGRLCSSETLLNNFRRMKKEREFSENAKEEMQVRRTNINKKSSDKSEQDDHMRRTKNGKESPENGKGSLDVRMKNENEISVKYIEDSQECKIYANDSKTESKINSCDKTVYEKQTQSRQDACDVSETPHSANHNLLSSTTLGSWSSSTLPDSPTTLSKVLNPDIKPSIKLPFEHPDSPGTLSKMRNQDGKHSLKLPFELPDSPGTSSKIVNPNIKPTVESPSENKNTKATDYLKRLIDDLNSVSQIGSGNISGKSSFGNHPIQDKSQRTPSLANWNVDTPYENQKRFNNIHIPDENYDNSPEFLIPSYETLVNVKNLEEINPNVFYDLSKKQQPTSQQHTKFAKRNDEMANYSSQTPDVNVKNPEEINPNVFYDLAKKQQPTSQQHKKFAKRNDEMANFSSQTPNLEASHPNGNLQGQLEVPSNKFHQRETYSGNSENLDLSESPPNDQVRALKRKSSDEMGNAPEATIHTDLREPTRFEEQFKCLSQDQNEYEGVLRLTPESDLEIEPCLTFQHDLKMEPCLISQHNLKTEPCLTSQHGLTDEPCKAPKRDLESVSSLIPESDLKMESCLALQHDLKREPCTASRNDVEVKPSTTPQSDLRFEPCIKVQSDLKTEPCSQSDLKTELCITFQNELGSKSSLIPQTDLKKIITISPQSELNLCITSPSDLREEPCFTAQSDLKRESCNELQNDLQVVPSIDPQVDLQSSETDLCRNYQTNSNDLDYFFTHQPRERSERTLGNLTYNLHPDDLKQGGQDDLSDHITYYTDLKTEKVEESITDSTKSYLKDLNSEKVEECSTDLTSKYPKHLKTEKLEDSGIDLTNYPSDLLNWYDQKMYRDDLDHNDVQINPVCNTDNNNNTELICDLTNQHNSCEGLHIHQTNNKKKDKKVSFSSENEEMYFDSTFSDYDSETSFVFEDSKPESTASTSLVEKERERLFNNNSEREDHDSLVEITTRSHDCGLLNHNKGNKDHLETGKLMEAFLPSSFSQNTSERNVNDSSLMENSPESGLNLFEMDNNNNDNKLDMKSQLYCHPNKESNNYFDSYSCNKGRENDIKEKTKDFSHFKGDKINIFMTRGPSFVNHQIELRTENLTQFPNVTVTRVRVPFDSIRHQWEWTMALQQEQNKELYSEYEPSPTGLRSEERNENGNSTHRSSGVLPPTAL